MVNSRSRWIGRMEINRTVLCTSGARWAIECYKEDVALHLNQAKEEAISVIPVEI